MINTLPQSLIETAKKILSESTHPMIDVDGEMKHRHNSDGQPIHHTDEGIRNFHRWFGKSKTVDEHGRPQVFYHGTDSNFDEFKKTHGTISTVFGSDKVDRHGHFFTDDKDLANTFSKSGNVMSVYLKAHNPLDMRNGVSDDKLGEFENHGLSPRWFTHSHMEDWERFDGDDGKDFTDTLNKMGHDSVIIHEPATSTQKGGSAFVVFHPHQIKSSESNTGEFSPNKNRITESTENRIREEHYNLNFWKRDAKKFGMNVSYNQKTNSVGKPILEEVEVWFAEDNDKKCHGIFFKGGETNYGHLIHEREKDISPLIVESFLSCYDDSKIVANNWSAMFEGMLNESFDYRIPDLIDVTHVAREKHPENFEYDDGDGVRNKKVEYSPTTKEVITTYQRAGAWEIHHQDSNEDSGVKKNNRNPPMKFTSHMFNWIKDKVNNNEMVRVVGTGDLIHGYKKVADSMANKFHERPHVSEITPSFNQRRDDTPVYEFLIHKKALTESINHIYAFRVPHLKYMMLRENYPDFPFVKEYEERLKKQGHQL